jgi:hypothetical protein
MFVMGFIFNFNRHLLLQDKKRRMLRCYASQVCVVADYKKNGGIYSRVSHICSFSCLTKMHPIWNWRIGLQTKRFH